MTKLYDLLCSVLDNDEALAGVFEHANAIVRYYGNEPYESIAELKRYDPELYDSMLSQIRVKLKYVGNNCKTTGDNVVAWRALSVSSNNVEQFLQTLKEGSSYVGIYWSFNKKNARPYWGNKRHDQVTCLLEAHVPFSSIDLIETVKANTTLAFSNAEDEVTCSKGKPVYVVSFTCAGVGTDVGVVNTI